MSDEIIIDISNTGKTTGLHFDKFPLTFLGALKVGRASEIFFNEKDQNWEVILPGQEKAIIPATAFGSYDEARSFEVEWLQACMKEDVHPTEWEGMAIAAGIRVDHIERIMA